MSLNKHINALSWLLPILYLVFCFTIFRISFNVFNSDIIASTSSLKELFRVYFLGMGYDVFAIILFNILLLFLILFFLVFLHKNWLKKGILWLTILVNSQLIIVSIADIPYYRFNNRRATSEVFDILGDSSSALPAFLIKYWGFVLLCFLCIYLLFIITRFSLRHLKRDTIAIRYLLFFTIFSIVFLYKTFNLLTPKQASFYVRPMHRSLVTNTSVSLMYSFIKGQEKLHKKTYFTKNKVESLFNIHQNFQTEEPFNKKNIFIFVLESFSQEYLIEGHRNKAPTPFLDSLMAKSWVFENTYANGASSAYGLMNILGGIPPFLEDSYFATIYGDNDIYGIGTLLKEKGYTSSFFYGAEKDHYGFRKNMALLDINNYYCQEDYKGDGFDGNWGIYDDPFFQYASEVIKNQNKPVFATLFNISSHLPYMVPKELVDILPKGTLSAHQSIAYVDYAIHNFFKSIESEIWFKQSLFIFIADHWAKRRDMEFKNDVGRYRIPFFIYDPEVAEHKVTSTITQQLDVIPTILDYLHYSGPWMSFGRSAIKSTKDYKFTFNEYENIYQIIDSTFVLAYDENLEKSFSLYNYKQDPELTKNLLNLFPDSSFIQSKYVDMEQNIKAVIQTYNNHLVDNDVFIRPRQ